MQLLRFRQVNPATQQGLQLQAQGNRFQQGLALLEVHQQIEVAFRPFEPPSN